MNDFTIAYFLNAPAGFIKPIKLPKGPSQHENIRRRIGCERLAILKARERHLIFSDHDGLKPGLPCFTELAGRPFGGSFVITGYGDNDAITSPTETIEEVAKHFWIARPVLDPDLEMINQSGITGGNAFRPRLLREHPTVIGEAN